MATKHTFNFTDTGKTSFDVQSYTANGIKVPSSDELLESASTANTTLKLYGKGFPDYGEGVFQNLVYMLENFANSTKPEFSIEGQMWYNNVGTGSPVIGPELFIRTATGNGDDIVADWSAVLLATGTSAMTAELILAGNPTNPLHAIPLSLLSTHETNFELHISPSQNTFLDGLDIAGSPPALTATDVNRLIGITGNVQALLDDKLNRSTDAMDLNANLTFSGTGEVLGLPATPSSDTAAASKKYVDDSLATGAGGDGVLTSIAWQSAAGSPPIIDTNQTTALFTIVNPDTTEVYIELDGITRLGHDHPASSIVVDNTFNPNYTTNVQGSLEFIDSEITQIKTIQDSVVLDTIDTIDRVFELLASTITSPTPYEVPGHTTDDNKLSITVNGIKQYTHAHGFQEIVYNVGPVGVFADTATGLDEALNYNFNVSVDGAANVLVTLTAGMAISTHSELIASIDSVMNVASPPILDNLLFSLISQTHERFTADSSGTGSSISITDPGGSPDIYLFEVDLSPNIITGATFISDPEVPVGSPPASIPDTIEIVGNVSSSFTVGQPFAIRGSVDTEYVTYDGIYSVHANGVVVGGTPLTTTIPIAIVDDSTTNTPLIPVYSPAASPPMTAPSPSAFGSVYITPIVGIDSVDAAVAGIEGDYTETDVLGLSTRVGFTTSYVAFNYDILSGSKIETLNYS